MVFGGEQVLGSGLGSAVGSPCGRQSPDPSETGAICIMGVVSLSVSQGCFELLLRLDS